MKKRVLESGGGCSHWGGVMLGVGRSDVGGGEE